MKCHYAEQILIVYLCIPYSIHLNSFLLWQATCPWISVSSLRRKACATKRQFGGAANFDAKLRSCKGWWKNFLKGMVYKGKLFQKWGGVPPKSSILIGFSLINHPFWGTTIFCFHPGRWSNLTNVFQMGKSITSVLSNLFQQGNSSNAFQIQVHFIRKDSKNPY